MIYNYLLKK